jgi:hypothetical protein
MRALFLTILLAGVAAAQSDRTSIRGTVTDPSGAALPGVSVTLATPLTGFERTVLTSIAGAYLLPGAPIGKATLRFEKSGFQTVLYQDVTLFAGQPVTQNVRLALAPQSAAVEVRVDASLLNLENAEIGGVVAGSQVANIPLNGRNWQGLLLLAPGAVNTGNGDARGIRFTGHGQDDNNYRFDGVDATGVRNQVPRDDVRLAMSLESIAEFRVRAATYTAETGGTTAAQVDIVSRSGANDFHGSFFEYLRNDKLDARSPFDPARIPPFRLNQFGASVGGRLVKDKTFFFVNYEGLAQRLGRTLSAFVPSDAFRARAAAASPQAQPLLDAYPRATGATAGADVGTWSGPGSQDNDQHSGMLRIDHRFSASDSLFGRVGLDDMQVRTPLGDGTGYLGAYNRVAERVGTGVINYQHVHSQRFLNEALVGFNRVPYSSRYSSPILPALSVAGFTSIPGGRESLVNSTTYTLADHATLTFGRHTFKTGLDVRRVGVALRTTADGSSIAYRDANALAADVRTSAQLNGFLPTRGIRKTQYFAFVQDEFRIQPNLTAIVGLRYESFGVFSEAHGRAQVFDLETCNGFCPAGAEFTFPDHNNVSPRVSLAWSPTRFGGRTVLRAGFGMYYGEGQLGNQTSPVENEASRITLSGAALQSTPLATLLNPVLPNSPTTFTTTPLDLQRNRQDMYTTQWSFTLQQTVARGTVAEAGYLGGKGTQLFERTYYNTVDPATGRRPYPQWDLIRVRANGNDSSFHALLLALRRQTQSGLTVSAHYGWSHSIDNTTAGGDDADYPQNVNCRSCERASSNFDIRHNFNSSVVYELPFGPGKRYAQRGGVAGALTGGWRLSGVGAARTGRPLTITISRTPASLPDQNATSPQRPDVVTGVSLIPQNQSRTQWINLAAFAAPAAGKWGNAGRNLATGPSVWNIDAGLAKHNRLSERMALEFRAEIFNLFNHPQLANPVVNVAAPATFGRITQLINTGATGSGTPRQIEFALRLSF